jgi:glyoxylase I family protein
MPIEMRGVCPLLQVYDMPASVRFYRDALGFEVHSASPPRSEDDSDWVWLKRDSTELMLNTRYEFDSRPLTPDPALIAAHDDICLYIGCPDVDAAYQHLLDKGLKLDPPRVAWYGMKQLYLKDPDGFGICFQWRAQPWDRTTSLRRILYRSLVIQVNADV